MADKEKIRGRICSGDHCIDIDDSAYHEVLRDTKIGSYTSKKVKVNIEISKKRRKLKKYYNSKI